MSTDAKHVQENLKLREEFHSRLRQMEKKHNEQIAQLKANPGQPQNAQLPTPPLQRKMTHDQIMNKLRSDGIKAYGERASRSWEQGAYDPQGQFWMQFWDFLFNTLTEVLLRAGYLDPNKIARGLVDDVKDHAEENPQGRPPALMRRSIPIR